uniref:Uncharacterized protein n=1 Tax=Cucumis sativus TaxID=3659 RepID=A0A0A0L9I9_CUCSA
MEFGIEPVSSFRPSNARLNICNFPKSDGISPVIRLFLRSNCVRLPIFTIDAGILPEIAFSPRLSRVRRFKFPISEGISPLILFPTRSITRRLLSFVKHFGISPDIPFQSATTRIVRLSSLQISGEIEPVIYPVLPAFSKIGSSDSPRRVMSVTLRVSGSQLTPYQPPQQEFPVHELKIPK